MKRLFITILTILFGHKPEFHKDNPRGVYRMPGEIENNPIITDNQTTTWLQRLKERLNKMSYDNFLNHAWKTFGLLLAIFGICVILFTMNKILFSNGNVDYCYIERWTYIKEINPGLMPPKEDPDPDQTIKKNSTPLKDQNLVIVYELKGHRPWRGSRDIGRFESFEATIEAAHKINCAVEPNSDSY